MVMAHTFRDSMLDVAPSSPVHFIDPLCRVKLEFVQFDFTGGSDASDATEASSEDDSGSSVLKERADMVRV
jgi:hypothetical protein